MVEAIRPSQRQLGQHPYPHSSDAYLVPRIAVNGCIFQRDKQESVVTPGM